MAPSKRNSSAGRNGSKKEKTKDPSYDPTKTDSEPESDQPTTTEEEEEDEEAQEEEEDESTSHPSSVIDDSKGVGKRTAVRGRKRKAPPPPSNAPNAEPPPPKKTQPKKRATKTKREKPNIFSTRDNFKGNSQNEYVVRQPDNVEKLHNFRLFFNDERTRGVIFDYNKFKTKEGKDIKTPYLFLFNYWDEKPENIKFPDSDDGKRETTAKFKPGDIPLLEKGLQAIKMLNTHIFNRITFKDDFDPQDFVRRVVNGRNTKRAEVEEIVEDVQRHEERNGGLPSLV